jgi:hypothetical protein
LRFPACHGIEIEPADIGLDLGWLQDRPPASVSVEIVEELRRAAAAELVWQLVEPPDFGLPAITTETWREADGNTWIGNTLNMALRVDYANAVVTVAPKNGNRQVLLEALASLALPLLAQHRGALVLHGAAVAQRGRGILLCAVGGSGKSSLLMGLASTGWEAISEDQCVVDWDEFGSHRVWPGPSWVRLKQGVPPTTLVVGTAPRFEAVDKVAWDLAEWIAHAPAHFEKIVLLEPPGGDEVVWEALPPERAIPELASHVTWIQGREDFAPQTLPQVVRLTMEVPAFRMRLPIQEDWLEHGVALIAES